MSWWELGEGSGYSGSELQLDLITCAFCDESGNFELEHRAEKRKANDRKTLNFDTYRCGNCAGYVMVLWSASSSAAGLGAGMYGYHVLPWPSRVTKAPEEWPDNVGRYLAAGSSQSVRRKLGCGNGDGPECSADSPPGQRCVWGNAQERDR